MKKLFCLILLACLIMAAPAAHADSVWEMAESPDYGTKAGGMLGRGFLNVATSPLDLVVQTVEKTQTGPPLIGTLVGLGSGLGCTAIRASSGLVDVATFWAPNFNGFTISQDYSNCLDMGSKDTAAYDSEPVYTNYADDAPARAVTTVAAPVQNTADEMPMEKRMPYVKGSQSQPASDYTNKTPQENRMQYVK